ncbi:hypothetical protein [Halorussus marinus]|uniref:hypothetical protein n=1 Tax=Halorussus marinus TaxID=2505976 RepID=UPI0010925E24|nr:hypothetical protein [Halorussus marinus]
MNRTLYSLAIPSNAQTLTQSQIARNVATHGILNESTAAVESLSLEPGQQLLEGQFRGKYARLMAEEVEELFDAGAMGSVAFYSPDGQSGEDGYYTLDNIDLQPVDPNLDELRDFDGVLTKEGTRENSRRSVQTAITQVENDYGNRQTAYVGIHANAQDVWWLDQESGQTEDATVVDTRTAEHGDVDVVDALASSYDSPTLVFDLPYAQEGKVDVVVWDDHGRPKLDSDGINSWQWVFSTSHEYDGEAIADNGLVRLRLGSSLAVEEWDDAGGAWSAVALGTSDWELDDWSLTRIGPARVVVRVRFADAIAPAIVGQAIVGESTVGTTSTNNYQDFELDAVLHRGWRRPHWVVPENETPPTPSGLQDLLAPVASGSDYTAAETQGLVSREEVWR